MRPIENRTVIERFRCRRKRPIGAIACRSRTGRCRERVSCFMHARQRGVPERKHSARLSRATIVGRTANGAWTAASARPGDDCFGGRSARFRRRRRPLFISANVFVLSFFPSSFRPLIFYPAGADAGPIIPIIGPLSFPRLALRLALVPVPALVLVLVSAEHDEIMEADGANRRGRSCVLLQISCRSPGRWRSNNRPGK